MPAACLVAACSPGPGSAIPETRTEKQMLGLLEKFDRWDYDGDGELSAGEIDAGIARLKANDRAVTFKGADVVKYYDQNGDGTISLREAQAGYHRTTQNGATPLQQ
jgi:Ca2+-binding EF-hand superfamily protein